MDTHTDQSAIFEIVKLAVKGLLIIGAVLVAIVMVVIGGR